MFAQETTGPASDNADQYWQTQCAGPERKSELLICTATQSIRVAKSGELLFRIKLISTADSQATVLELQGPLNIYLPDGYTLSVDGTDLTKVAISNCNSNGCFGAVKLNSDHIAVLKKGKTLKIMFSPAPKKSRYVETPLAGFTRAMQAIL